jgi:hypothetical protein
MAEAAVVRWLLDSDPALRWQVERDLAALPEAVWRATRARVASEGFGARLLAQQDADGQWAGGAYRPADFTAQAGGSWDAYQATLAAVGEPWTATTWSLTLLREWGANATALADTAERLAAHCRWEYDDLPYWSGEVDCCINAMTLSNGLWLGADVDGLVDWFLEHRLPDGGWNCAWTEGKTVSSFHSTLNSLKGLLDYERSGGDRARVAEARRTGEEYLLTRHLFRRRTTGEPVGDFALHLGYPFFWRYSVLNAADHFRAAAVHAGTPPDPRMSEAIEHIRAARRPDGTWLQGGRARGAMWFEVDAPTGEPSKWLTLIGTRVLDWWDAHR